MRTHLTSGKNSVSGRITKAVRCHVLISLMCLLLATPLTLLTATGCSGDPAVAVSGADQPFSDEELVAMRKSAKTGANSGIW